MARIPTGMGGPPPGGPPPAGTEGSTYERTVARRQNRSVLLDWGISRGRSLLTWVRRNWPITEDTTQFIIKALTVGVVIVILYFIISPYHTCMRGGDVSSRVFCWVDTNISW